MLTAMIVASFALTALMPVATIAAIFSQLHIGDASRAAIIGGVVAGIFSLVNTWLNARILRQISATKQAARSGSDALLELANVRAEDKPSSGEK